MEGIPCFSADKTAAMAIDTITAFASKPSKDRTQDEAALVSEAVNIARAYFAEQAALQAVKREASNKIAKLAANAIVGDKVKEIPIPPQPPRKAGTRQGK